MGLRLGGEARNVVHVHQCKVDADCKDHCKNSKAYACVETLCLCGGRIHGWTSPSSAQEFPWH
ncbi:unnamed protein product [Ilex paraguariensis]|uniref:Uncharacterized protein n=1 Tax=Ilex paraguariensis TaxID=185542 RepID=A0ABC8UKW3_9AQUA